MLRGRRVEVLIAVMVPVLVLAALVSWGLSSAPGSSPDDDYHLASIWCAGGDSAGECEPTTDEERRLVPVAVAQAPHCFAFNPGQSAACAPKSTEMISVDRGNWNGHGYPPVFYATMSLFVSDSVAVSTVLMRTFNATLYVGLLTALFFLLPRRIRPPMVWGALITIVPLGMFLIPSVNPSSWALLSASGLWVATWGYLSQPMGTRKWLLAAITVVLLVIGAGARSDAAVYGVLAMAVGVLLSFRRDRRFLLELLLPVTLTVIAVCFFFSGGQSAVVGASTVVQHSELDPITLLQRNLLDLPLLWVGVFGLWGMGGLGWLDTSVPSVVWTSTLMLFAGLVFWGLRRGSVGKWLSVTGVALALVLVPLYILVHDGVTVGIGVQPRYIFPLIIMFAGIVLVGWCGAALGLGRVQLVVVGVILGVANAIALHINMRRYLTGVDVDAINLDSHVEWWWNMPASPMAVWAGGSVAFAAAVGLLISVAWHSVERRRPLETASLDDEVRSSASAHLRRPDSVIAGAPR